MTKLYKSTRMEKHMKTTVCTCTTHNWGRFFSCHQCCMLIYIHGCVRHIKMTKNPKIQKSCSFINREWLPCTLSESGYHATSLRVATMQPL